MSTVSSIVSASKGTSITNSGLSFDYLSSPKPGKIAKFILNFIDEPSIQNHPHPKISKVAKFSVCCNDVRSTCLPLDPDTGANPREPTKTGSKSDVVKAMQNTMTREPKMFDIKNGGITIVCQSFDFDSSKGTNEITILYKKWEGIVNGGHTYFSIQNMMETIDLESNVSIELISLVPSLKGNKRKEFIVQIAAARNRNSAIDDKSTANSMGFFNKWKKSLGNKSQHIEWKTNQTSYSGKGISAEEFIRRVHLFDFNQFKHHNLNKKPNAGLHKRWSGSGPAGAHKHWFSNTDNENDFLGHLNPLARDIMIFGDHILHDLTGNKWKNDSLPQRHATVSMGTSYGTKKLWGTAFGKWVNNKKEKKELHHLPGNKSGYPIPVTLQAILLGQFRDCVWALYTGDAKGKIGLIGWYDDPCDVWDIAGPNLLGALSEAYDNIHNGDPVTFRKNDIFYMMESLEWSGKSGLKSVHDKPIWFYDTTDKNQKYIREEENPTHYIELNPVNSIMGNLIELGENKIPEGKQGYKKV